MVKSRIAVVIFCVLVAGSNVFAANLLFGTQDFPPFSYTENGKAAGPGVKLIDAVCEDAGLKCDFKIGVWQGIQKRAKIDNGNVNALFFVGKNNDREKWLNFSPPVVKTEYGFFAKKDSNISYNKGDLLNNKGDRLNGYSVGVYGPSNTSKNLQKIKATGGGFETKMYEDSKTVFKILSATDRLNAVFSNREVGNSIIKQNDFSNLNYVGAYKSVLYYFAFSKAKVSEDSKNKFMESYQKLKNNGTVKDILASYHLETAE